jgi:hypothetical protein
MSKAPVIALAPLEGDVLRWQGKGRSFDITIPTRTKRSLLPNKERRMSLNSLCFRRQVTNCAALESVVTRGSSVILTEEAGHR